MFKINIFVKFALIAVFLGGGILAAFLVGFWWAFPLILIGLGLAVSYLLLGTVQSAADLMQLQQFEEAEKRLELTYKPEWLYVTNRSFYYIVKGSLEANKKNNKEAEILFEKALALDLPSDNEKAMVLLQLCNINANKGNMQMAKKYFADLKKLKVTEKQIKEQVELFEKNFAQYRQMKGGNMMGRKKNQMMQAGGKRRRPKMR